MEYPKHSFNSDKATINDIQTHPKFLKLKRLPDFSTYESMVMTINMFGLQPIDDNPLKNAHFQETNEDTNLLSYEDLEDVEWKEEISKSKIYKSDDNLDYKKTIIDAAIKQAKEYEKNMNAYHDIMCPYYNFRGATGIISMQSMCGKITDTPKNILIGKYEVRLCKIKKNYDAITNIIFNAGFTDSLKIPFEFVLKINGQVLCSSSVTKCTFIQFPNFIINSPKNHMGQKIEIYMRTDCPIAYTKCEYKINYDIILFDIQSRQNIFTKDKMHIFETTAGTICIDALGLIGVRYPKQLLDMVHADFKKFYEAYNLDEMDTKSNNSNNDNNNHEINENINITI